MGTAAVLSLVVTGGGLALAGVWLGALISGNAPVLLETRAGEADGTES